MDMAIASLCVLHGGLCFNICGLESSYLFNSEVPDLVKRVEAKIPPHLSYSCQFWANHLQGTKFDPVLAEHVKDIVGNERIPFWFEGLSLLGVLGNAAAALLNTESWLQVSIERWWSAQGRSSLKEERRRAVGNLSSLASYCILVYTCR